MSVSSFSLSLPLHCSCTTRSSPAPPAPRSCSYHACAVPEPPSSMWRHPHRTPPPLTSPPSFSFSLPGLKPSAARARPFFQGRRARLFRTVHHRHARATVAPPLFIHSVASSCVSKPRPSASCGHEPNRRPAESPVPTADQQRLSQARLLCRPFSRAPPEQLLCAATSLTAN
jgi:hypothetical protein